MFELDGELHIRRAMRQAERERQELDRIAAFSSPSPPSSNSANRIPSSPSTLRDRLAAGSSMLATGVGWGAAAGMLLGTYWAVSRRHPNPARVCILSTLNLAMLGGQFIAFRELAPVGLQRLTDRITSAVTIDNATEISDNATDISDNGTSINSASYAKMNHTNWFQRLSSTVPGGLDLPTVLYDLEADDEQVLGSALAGAAAGYLSTRLQAQHLATAMAVESLSSSSSSSSSSLSSSSSSLSSATARPLTVNHQHLGRVGVRGGIFWALLFGGGHWLMQRWHRWQVDRQIDQRIRDLYATENEDLIREYCVLGNMDNTTNNNVDNTTNNNNVDTNNNNVDTNNNNVDTNNISVNTNNYVENEDPSSVAHNSENIVIIPQRKQLVGMSLQEIASEPITAIKQYNMQWIFDWIPLVHDQKEYEYREYLESKIRLLETELDQLERKRRLRLKREQKRAEQQQQQQQQQNSL